VKVKAAQVQGVGAGEALEQLEEGAGGGLLAAGDGGVLDYKYIFDFGLHEYFILDFICIF
jgi:hypothetical protein